MFSFTLCMTPLAPQQMPTMDEGGMLSRWRLDPYTVRLEPLRGKDTRWNLDVGSLAPRVPYAAVPTIRGSVDSQKSQYCFLEVLPWESLGEVVYVTEKV